MPAAGGAARRLTWLGSELAVRGWTPDGRIVFCSNYGQPFFRNWHAWTLAPEGGAPERTAAGAGQPPRLRPRRRARDRPQHRRPGALETLPRRHRRPPVDRRHRQRRLPPHERTAGQCHLADVGRRPPLVPERLRRRGQPLLLRRRRQRAAPPHRPRRLLRPPCRQRRRAHRLPVRRRAVAVQPGASDRSERLDIDVPSARTQAARRFVPVAEHLHGVQLHPEGHSLALEARGQIFTMALWEGAVHRHGSGPARRRLGQWLADGQTLVAASDASGEERIEVHGGGTVRELPWDLGRLDRAARRAAGAPGGHRQPPQPAAGWATSTPAG